MLTIVIAGSHQQYVNWCRKEGIYPRGKTHRLVVNRDQLYGLRGCKVIRVGSWIDDLPSDFLREVDAFEAAQ